MSCAAQEDELQVLIRARYPLIYLVSWEEARVSAMLARIAQKQGKRLFFWSETGPARARAGRRRRGP